MLLGDTSFVFDFTASYDADGFSLAHEQQNNSGPLDPGTYSVSENAEEGWTLIEPVTCSDGSDASSIELSAGETVTCVFNNVADEVGASIVVDVDGTCEVDADGQGQGTIDVTISVDDGATVEVRNSADTVLGTFTSSGSVDVPEGATYTWQATPSEGFEFPAGSATSGSITIAACTELESLPFTGVDSDVLALLGAALLGAGLLTVTFAGGREEA